jgi:serine protease AprX
MALGLGAMVMPSPQPAATAGPVRGAVSTVGGVVKVVTGVLGLGGAGWDDTTTTPSTRIDQVVRAVGADQLWLSGYDGDGVGVALIDSGVAPVDGLDGQGKVISGPDLSFESQVPGDEHIDGFGHGTHMAGIIAGRDGIGGSFRGVAPGAHLLSLKVASHDGAADVSQMLAAINWVIEHKDDTGLNIRVLNLSFGTDSVQPSLVDPLAYAVETAWAKGIVVVVAGGNDGTTREALTDPAIDPYVIAVGASDLHATNDTSDDSVADFSSRGSTTRSVDVVAPGVSIASLRVPGSQIDQNHPSAVVDDRFFRGSGTSQATAVMAGAVADLLSARPSLTPDEVKAVFRATAASLPNADLRAQGAGQVNVWRAIHAPVPATATQSFAAATGTGSLEQARGTGHVADGVTELTGEQDIFGQPWVPAVWAPATAAGTTWSGGVWNGVEWTGGCWCTDDPSGGAWTGSSWQGKSWTGKSWTNSTWAGNSWTSAQPQGKSWTGKSWTGAAWTGKSWTGTSWTGKSWTSS